MRRGPITLAVDEHGIVGEFRHVVAGDGQLAAHYLPALAHALLARRPRPDVRVRRASAPWSAGTVHRCLLVGPGASAPGSFVAVHWARRLGDDLALGWALLHLPGEAETQDPSTPAAALAWAWAEQVHESAVVPVLAQLTGHH